MRIGEVSARTGVSVRMLRHYDSLGLVCPEARTESGYREYSPADLRRILHVEALRALGLSLAEVADALDDPSCAPRAVLADLMRRTRERIAAEEELLTRLHGIAATGPVGWDDVLDTIGLLTALQSNRPLDRHRAALAAGAGASAGGGAGAGVSAGGDASGDHGVGTAGEDVPDAAAERDAGTSDEGSGDAIAASTAGGAADGTAACAGAAGGPALSGQQLVRALLHEEETNVAGALRWALRRTGHDASELRAALGSARPEVRRRAVEALADMEGEAAGDALLCALDAEDGAIRTSAALALAARGRAEGVPGLLSAVIGGDRDVEAAEALGRLSRLSAKTGAHTVTQLCEALARLDRSGSESAARLRVVQALGELPQQAVTGLLEGIAAGPEPAEARIAHYLLSMHDPRT